MSTKPSAPARSGDTESPASTPPADPRVCIGLDPASSGIKAAGFRPGSETPEEILTRTGDAFFDGGVYVSQDDKLLLGDEALQASFADPGFYLKSIKPLRGKQLIIRGTVTVPDVEFALTTGVVVAAEESLGAKPTDVVLTCPCNSDDAYRKSIIDSAVRVGWNVLAMINEASAVAVHYNHTAADPVRKGQLIAIYDKGAYSTDCSVGRVDDDGSIHVLAADGVNDAGAVRFFETLMPLVFDRLHKKTGVRINLETMPPEAKYEFTQSLVRAVIALSSRAEVQVQVQAGGRMHGIPISVEDFKRVAKGYLRPLAECFNRVVKRSKVGPGEVKTVLAAGGLCRSPHLRAVLSDILGLPVVLVPNPQHAVALGAARHAKRLVEQQVAAAEFGSLPPALVDCTTSHVGLIVVTPDPRTGERTQIVRSLSSPGDPIPFRCELDCALANAGQHTLRAQIVQGREGDSPANALLIGEIVLAGLPPEAIRSKRIKILLEITAHSNAKVTVTDTVSGKTVTAVFEFPNGDRS